jgi:hypothetical protein
MVTVHFATAHFVAWHIHFVVGARFTPLVQRVSLCIDMATRSMAGKGKVHFVRCGVGNSYYDVVSPGEAQIAHTVRATLLFL